MNIKSFNSPYRLVPEPNPVGEQALTNPRGPPSVGSNKLHKGTLPEAGAEPLLPRSRLLNRPPDFSPSSQLTRQQLDLVPESIITQSQPAAC